MSAEDVFSRLKDSRDKYTTIDKKDRDLILDRVQHLEQLAAELLRSIVKENPEANITIPFRKKPA